ncbi:MAG: dTDP-4-dehydrorhamnose 3,5-epimerase family protein [Magnetococcales bacterium]|nr:dTDP-4-dehydrorhamnose 3,5-epimerase family protein [Magnetococcales bacterium]
MSRRFDVQDTPLEGVKLIHRRPIGDSRGYLERMFCADELAPLIANRNIVQINRTLTVKQGVVRGLHYQLPPYAETKLVCCLRGEVFDVAVDLRRNSATFLHWHATVLHAEKPVFFLVPEGFAHGFQTLTAGCEMLYFHTAPYQAGSERALNVRDPRLGIRWPQEITELSDRDCGHPLLSSDFQGLDLGVV